MDLFLFIVASLAPALNGEHVPQRDHVPPVALVAAAASEQVGMGVVAVTLFDLPADATLECRFLWIHHKVSFLFSVQFKLFFDSHNGAHTLSCQLRDVAHGIAFVQVADDIPVLLHVPFVTLTVPRLASELAAVLHIAFPSRGQPVGDTASLQFGAGTQNADEDVEEGVLGSVWLEDVQVLLLEVDVDAIVLAVLHVGQHLVNVTAQTVEGVDQQSMDRMGFAILQALAQCGALLILLRPGDVLTENLLDIEPVPAGVVHEFGNLPVGILPVRLRRHSGKDNRAQISL